MPRVSKKQHAFNAGEVSPEFFGRTDIEEKYGTACSVVENFIIHSEGGAHRRTGSRFVGEAIDSSKKSRLVRFVFSTEQAYILEFSEFKIRVFADEVQIDVLALVSNNPSTTTDEFNPTGAASTNHGFSKDQGPFHVTTGGTLPVPLLVDTDYFISLPRTITFDASSASDVNVTNEQITTTPAHEYSDEMGPFRLTTTALDPTPLGGDTDYFVKFIDATHIQLSLTAGGAAINLTGLGVGTCTLAPTGAYLRDKFRLAESAGGSPIDITSITGGSSTTFTPNPDGTPASLPVEIDTPFTEAQLFELKFDQSADFLFITHNDHRPTQLTRSSNTKWSLNFQDIVDGPYEDENTDAAITMNPSATTGYITVIKTGGTTPSVDDIGKLLRIKHGSVWGYMEIFEVDVGGAVYHGRVRNAFGAATAKSEWRIGTFSALNWPKSTAFFEQRFALAGETLNPNTLHGSETNAYNSFPPTDTTGSVQDTSAVKYVIGVGGVNAIEWMTLGNRLVLGTSDALFTARGTLDGEAMTPTSIQIQRITSHGANTVQPVRVSDRIVYITSNHQSVLSFSIGSDTESIIPDNVTLLAKHILGRILTVTDMAYQQDRQQILWVVRSDGVLAACTYVPEQRVFPWHRHIVGGSFGSGTAQTFLAAAVTVADNSITISGHDYVEQQGPFLLTTSAADLPAGLSTGTNYYIKEAIDLDTFTLAATPTGDVITITDQGTGTHTIIESGDAVVESVAVIPSMDGTHDQVWISVKRTVNGSTVRHIEFIEDEWLTGTDTDMRYFDSAPVAYSGAAKSTFDGLDHLEGETIQVLANGADHPDRVVSSGSITLDASYTDVAAGLGYTSISGSLPLDLPDPEGSAMGKKARFDHIIMRLFDTVSVEYGPDLAHMDELVLRDAEDAMDTSVPAATGDFKRRFPAGHLRDNRVFFRQRRPLPCNILSYSVLGSTGQR